MFHFCVLQSIDEGQEKSKDNKGFKCDTNLDIDTLEDESNDIANGAEVPDNDEEYNNSSDSEEHNNPADDGDQNEENNDDEDEIITFKANKRCLILFKKTLSNSVCFCVSTEHLQIALFWHN